jgi:hypothetical protein
MDGPQVDTRRPGVVEEALTDAVERPCAPVLPAQERRVGFLVSREPEGGGTGDIRVLQSALERGHPTEQVDEVRR